jgi:hypothetical protein
LALAAPDIIVAASNAAAKLVFNFIEHSLTLFSKPLYQAREARI